MDRNSLLMAWGLALALSFTPATAQEGALTAMYGKGVHLYFSGDMFAANDAFTAAIDSGSVDPRVYFYRGLNYLRMNRQPEATADFAKGAALEAAAPGPPFDVNRALVRIQGSDRLAIERFRQKARMDAVVADQARQRERYEQMRENEPRMILTPPTETQPRELPAPGLAPPPAEAAPAETTPPPTVTPPAAVDPFAEPAPAAPAAATPPAENPSATPPAENPPVESAPVLNPPAVTPQVEAPPPAEAAPQTAPATPAAPATPPAAQPDPFAPPPPDATANPPAEKP